MKNIKVNEVKQVVTDAVNNNLKNILFVSRTCDYFEILKWFDEHPMYQDVRINPSPMWEEDQYGILRKFEDTCVIVDASLNLLNNENSICLLPYFGDESYHRTDKMFDIIKDRKYINILTRGEIKEFDLSKLKMLIAVTAPKGMFSLDKKYYDYFDEVYVMNK